MLIDRTGADVSKFRSTMLSATTVAIITSLFIVPVSATSVAVTDFCANIKTGQIHPLISGTCLTGERSLGLGKLIAQSHRPHRLDPQLVARFNAARTVGASHGYHIGIRSGWRSVNHQQQMFNAAVKKYGSVALATKWVLPPTKSLHTWGLAIDVKYSGDIKGAAWWFQKYSAHFGLCRRYKNEWWHYEALVSPGQPCPALETSAKSGLR